MDSVIKPSKQGVTSLKPYPSEIEQEMKKFYESLSEKDKRRYAAVEALKLGHGGIVYLAKVFGCHRSTISTGISELKDLSQDPIDKHRIRRKGGGRKPYEKTHPAIDKQFLEVLAHRTAGDPMDESIYWTNLSPQEIANRLAEKHDVKVSVTVTRKLLTKHGYRRRKIQKKDDERG
jgi:hypothetical protein